MERIDCVIIGAGWFGLGVAKQLHCTMPGASMAILDAQATLGGTWAQERLYPGLVTNNLLGTLQYPDFPMSPSKFNVKPGGYIPGQVVHNYLNAYAAEFGIKELARLNTKVISAEHQEDTEEGGWILTTVTAPSTQDKNQQDQSQKKIYARRLIYATGLTSEPFLPRFDGQDEFEGPVFHSKQFREYHDTVQTAKAVTVLGGGKFAYDAAYTYANAGVQVEWIIRSSGHGPCWMAPSYVTPFKKWIEKLAHTRLLTWFSPCIWGDSDGYSLIRRVLHGTAIGRFIVDFYWKTLASDVMTLNKYDEHPEVAKLKPWTEAMTTGTSFSILNYERDIFSFVRSGQIRVHIGEIKRLSSGGKVHLADGTILPSDALIASTGWKHVPAIKFLPEGIERELGIPHALSSDPDDENDLGNRKDLLDRADEEILSRFPRLRRRHVWNPNYVPLPDQKGIQVVEKDDNGKEEAAKSTPYSDLTSWMLYRFMVPPSPRFLGPRDTLFAGVIASFSNCMTAHLQGLWASSFFQGKLARDPFPSSAPPSSYWKGEQKEKEAAPHLMTLDQVRYSTVLHNRFGKWRYPVDWGTSRNPSFIFDAVPYLDMLQRDLGLEPHRKKRNTGGFLAEVTDPYGPEDFTTINEDWKKRWGGEKVD